MGGTTGDERKMEMNRGMMVVWIALILWWTVARCNYSNVSFARSHPRGRHVMPARVQIGVDNGWAFNEWYGCLGVYV